jgi:hypothetical protein
MFSLLKKIEERERLMMNQQKQIEEQLTPRPADKRVIEIEQRVDSMIKKNAVSPSKPWKIMEAHLEYESLKMKNSSPPKSKIPTPKKIKAQLQGDEDEDTPKANQNQMSEAELARKFNAQRAAMARGKIIPGLWKV